VCGFLGLAADWDGTDGRWDNFVMEPAETAQLLAGLSGADDSAFQRVCGNGPDVERNYSDPDFDTSGGAQSCLLVHGFCLGKADSLAADQPPPWETDATTSVTTGGCSIALDGGAAGAWPAGMLLLFLASFARRRRR
jgi:MYXO-CTERM domain-containing protein